MTDFVEVARRVGEMIAVIDDDVVTFRSDKQRQWYDETCIQIALRVGDDEILYLDHNIQIDSTLPFHVLVLTARMVVVVEVVEGTGVWEFSQIRLLDRDDLNDVNILKVSNAAAGNARWPSLLSIELTYPSDSFKLPFRSYDKERQGQLLKLIPALARNQISTAPVRG